MKKKCIELFIVIISLIVISGCVKPTSIDDDEYLWEFIGDNTCEDSSRGPLGDLRDKWVNPISYKFEKNQFDSMNRLRVKGDTDIFIKYGIKIYGENLWSRIEGTYWCNSANPEMPYPSHGRDDKRETPLLVDEGNCQLCYNNICSTVPIPKTECKLIGTYMRTMIMPQNSYDSEYSWTHCLGYGLGCPRNWQWREGTASYSDSRMYFPGYPWKDKNMIKYYDGTISHAASNDYPVGEQAYSQQYDDDLMNGFRFVNQWGFPEVDTDGKEILRMKLRFTYQADKVYDGLINGKPIACIFGGFYSDLNVLQYKEVELVLVHDDSYEYASTTPDWNNVWTTPVPTNAIDDTFTPTSTPTDTLTPYPYIAQTQTAIAELTQVALSPFERTQTAIAAQIMTGTLTFTPTKTPFGSTSFTYTPTVVITSTFTVTFTPFVNTITITRQFDIIYANNGADIYGQSMLTIKTFNNATPVPNVPVELVINAGEIDRLFSEAGVPLTSNPSIVTTDGTGQVKVRINSYNQNKNALVTAYCGLGVKEVEVHSYNNYSYYKFINLAGENYFTYDGTITESQIENWFAIKKSDEGYSCRLNNLNYTDSLNRLGGGTHTVAYWIQLACGSNTIGAGDSSIRINPGVVIATLQKESSALFKYSSKQDPDITPSEYLDYLNGTHIDSPDDGAFGAKGTWGDDFLDQLKGCVATLRQNYPTATFPPSNYVVSRHFAPQSFNSSNFNYIFNLAGGGYYAPYVVSTTGFLYKVPNADIMVSGPAEYSLYSYTPWVSATDGGWTGSNDSAGNRLFFRLWYTQGWYNILNP